MSACAWCGSDAVDAGSVCPKSIACPDCRAQPGQRCVAPSGHPRDVLHSARITLAEGRAVQTRIGAPDEPVRAPEPRTDAMRLFEPAPTQIPGQQTLS